jgi:hypothetical protein
MTFRIGTSFSAVEVVCRRSRRRSAAQEKMERKAEFDNVV